MSTNPLIVKYPLDLTGVSSVNLVLKESQSLPDGSYRALIPDYGAFFADSFVLRDSNSGDVLLEGDDYTLIQAYDEATDATGQLVCAGFVVTNPSVTTTVDYDYQAIGGEFTHNVANLREMLTGVDWTTVTLSRGVRVGDPPAYPPMPHLHDAGDEYTFAYLVMALERLAFALMVGNEVDHDVLRVLIADLGDAMDLALSNHFNDEGDPHQVTKAQVGLGDVENYPIATTAQMVTGTNHTSYTTPLRVAEGIDEHFGKDFTAHLNDESDPHQVTKEQVGLRYAENTSDLAKPVTHAFQQQLSSHTTNASNPHNVTSAQVDTYTKSQWGNLLNQRLHVNGTADNSNRLQWWTAQGLKDRIQSDAIARARNLYAYSTHYHGYASRSHSH